MLLNFLFGAPYAAAFLSGSLYWPPSSHAIWPPSGRRVAVVWPLSGTGKHHRRHAQHSPTPLGSRPQSPTTGHDAAPCTTHHAPRTTCHTPRTTHCPTTAPACQPACPSGYHALPPRSATVHHALFSQPQVHGTSVLLVVQPSTVKIRLTRSLTSSTPPFTKFSHGNPRLR